MWGPLGFAALVTSCAPPPVEDDGWLGPEEHFRAEGFLDGQDVDLHDLVDVTCELEWEVPTVDGVADFDRGRMTDLRVEGDIAARSFALELKRHDFQSDRPGDVVAVVPRNDRVEPGAAEAWVEWEWHTSGQDLYDQAARSGTIVLGLMDGELDATGLVFVPGSARAGAWLEARWSPTEALTVSFTVPCVETTLERVE